MSFDSKCGLFAKCICMKFASRCVMTRMCDVCARPCVCEFACGRNIFGSIESSDITHCACASDFTVCGTCSTSSKCTAKKYIYTRLYNIVQCTVMYIEHTKKKWPNFIPFARSFIRSFVRSFIRITFSLFFFICFRLLLKLNLFSTISTSFARIGKHTILLTSLSFVRCVVFHIFKLWRHQRA